MCFFVCVCVIEKERVKCWDVTLLVTLCPMALPEYIWCKKDLQATHLLQSTSCTYHPARYKEV